MSEQSRVVILLGPPGSGKGTQAARLAETIGLMPFSTGELLRREARSGSAIGEQVRGLMAAGFLVSDHLMNEIVARQLASGACPGGYILDGFPRTIEQARWLHKNMNAEPLVFDFVVSAEKVIERLSHRRQCPACSKIYSAEFDVYGKDMVCEADGTPLVRRADDNPQTIRERLQIYSQNARDLVAFYKPRRYFAIDAMQSPEEISAQLLHLCQCRERVAAS